MTGRQHHPERQPAATGGGKRAATSTGKRGKAAEPEAPDLTALAKEWSELRALTGSDSGMFNLKLLNQVWNALWRLENGAEWARRMGEIAARDALRGVAPRDPLEGMLRIPMKPAGHSNLKPATCSETKPAAVPL